MKLSKKSALLIALLAGSMLAGCQNTNNTITFSTPSPTAMFNPNNQTALVNVMTTDLRPTTEIANYTKHGQLHRVNASPDATYLFQQVMQQNLNSKGFTVVQGAGNANVTVSIRKFYADVEQGNLRYKLSANVGVDVKVQGARGQFSKSFNTFRGYEGAFGADKNEIQKVLGQAYTDAVHAIYNDNEVTNAIHQFK